jgi:putative ABC transport system ATP-binding protein
MSTGQTVLPAGGTIQLAAHAIEVTKTYGKGPAQITALDRLSLAFGRGRFSAVMGPSGSGKSTLLHCMAGLEPVDQGEVHLDGIDLTKLDERRLTRLRRDRVGFVFQSFNLLPTLTAAENIELPLAIAGRRPDRAFLDRVVDALELGDRLRHRPAELSGGEQQRVATARALVGRPAVVFADEPTGNLDSRSTTELLGFLRRSVDELGQTVVMVTHDPVAAGDTDEVVFLADGRIVDRMADPTAGRVLDRMKALGG